jgi:hypothetical protein
MWLCRSVIPISSTQNHVDGYRIEEGAQRSKRRRSGTWWNEALLANKERAIFGWFAWSPCRLKGPISIKQHLGQVAISQGITVSERDVASGVWWFHSWMYLDRFELSSGSNVNQLVLTIVIITTLLVREFLCCSYSIRYIPYFTQAIGWQSSITPHVTVNCSSNANITIGMNGLSTPWIKKFLLFCAIKYGSNESEVADRTRTVQIIKVHWLHSLRGRASRLLTSTSSTSQAQLRRIQVLAYIGLKFRMEIITCQREFLKRVSLHLQSLTYPIPSTLYADGITE